MQEVAHLEGDGAAVHGRVVIERAIVRHVRANRERDRLRLQHEKGGLRREDNTTTQVRARQQQCYTIRS